MTPLCLTFEQIRDAAQATVLQPVQGPFSEFVYDSRLLSPDSIFICLPGQRVDGHDFMAEAIRKKTRLIIGQNKEKLAAAVPAAPQVGFLWVPDITRALQSVATYYRTLFSLPVIAVVGANGKTTTKDFIRTILESAGPALGTEGSLNNHYGVPQTVLQLRAEHRAAVFEIGTNHFGEVLALSAIVQPTIGVVVSAGHEHCETLIDEEGSLRANAELIDWMLANSRTPTFIINIDNDTVARLPERYPVIPFGQWVTVSDSQPAAVQIIEMEPAGPAHQFGWNYMLETPWGELRGVLPVPGRHNMGNAALAVAAALATATVSPQQAASALASPRRSQMRSSLRLLKNGMLLMNDAYNANPSSVNALFGWVNELREYSPPPISHVIAVVGDMLELGPDAEKRHREAGAMAARQGISTLLAKGTFAEAWKAGFTDGGGPKAFAFREMAGVAPQLKKELAQAPPETLLILKGSRAARMEEILNLLPELS